MDGGGFAFPNFVMSPPNDAMRYLLDLLEEQGFMIIRGGSNDWKICCPYHPDRGPGVNAHTVRLEQRPNKTVWIHSPAGYSPCSCTAEQIITAIGCTNPRIAPAGTIITDAALREMTATAVRESHGAITWDDGPTDAADWLDKPLIERGQFISIYGPAGIGKSLLAQERAARLSHAGRRVLYFDAENPLNEVKARLHAMGYGAADLANLIYLSFPSLPPLDTAAGAASLATIVDTFNPDLVVLDTWSKFLAGDEASPNTHTNAYNQSIVPLRRRSIAVQAIDHSGKDAARGPRGGSSKVDNVDALWLVTAKADGRLRLERRKSRTGRGPDLVELARRVDPLRHERIDLAPADTLTPEARACVAKLDELEVPAGWGRARAAQILRANAYSVRNETLAEALRVRRERGTAPAETVDLSPDLGDSRGQVNSEARGQVGDR